MRIIEKHDIEKVVDMLKRIRSGYIQPFKPSRYPPYLFWNATGEERSDTHPSLYITPGLLTEAEKLIPAEPQTAL